MIFDEPFSIPDSTNAGADVNAPRDDARFSMRVARPRPTLTSVAVTGALDMATLARFTEVVHERLNSACPSVVLDLSRVTFLSASGIEALLQLQQRAEARDQHVTLVSGAHAVDRPLQALGLAGRFAYGDPALLAATANVDEPPAHVSVTDTVAVAQAQRA